MKLTQLPNMDSPNWFLKSRLVPSHHKDTYTVLVSILNTDDRSQLAAPLVRVLDGVIPQHWDRGNGSAYQKFILELIAHVCRRTLLI